MSDMLHLQLEQNIKVSHHHIYLQDIARLSCSNPKILNKLRVMPVINLDKSKPGRYVMSAMDLVTLIQKQEPALEINTIGEPKFIITYTNRKNPSKIWEWCKVFFVGLASFFGAAFSIMTFNNDVDLGNLFSKIYSQVTGSPSSGFTILEIAYSAGVGLGVLFFFNHFGHMKPTSDPTPMQVQMRAYEDDVNTTILESPRQSENHKNPL